VGSAALIRLQATRARHLLPRAVASGTDPDLTWPPSRFDQCADDLPTPPIPGRLIYVRLTRAGFRPIDLYLFTTLLDREAFSLTDLVALYGSRWNVELDLRHVKTTLQMEHLDSRSVDMVRKELILGLVAYNLLRDLMGVAAQQANRAPLELSPAQCWRRTLDACRSLPLNAMTRDLAPLLEQLLARLGRCLLPKRKREHFEPRAVWGTSARVSQDHMVACSSARQVDEYVKEQILVTLGCLPLPQVSPRGDLLRSPAHAARPPAAPSIGFLAHKRLLSSPVMT
jgi:Transposase DDE domain